MVRTLIPWTPRVPQALGRWENEMNRLMERFFSPDDDWQRGEAFVPRTDLVETEEEYQVMVELPGMKAEDFGVEFKQGNLWVSGERKEEKHEDGKTFHRIETHYGQFCRVIPLPGAVDEDKVEAHYRDGILHINVPKAAAARPKKIAVKG